MVIVKLSGGLGNQMFQYACGRHISQIKQTKLKLDLSALKDKTPKPDITFRDYELNVFNYTNELASKWEINSFIKPKSFFKKIIFKVKQVLNPGLIVTDENFDINLIRKYHKVYLDGYFQNEKYFKEILDILRTDFSLKAPISDYSNQLRKEISENNSVSIHVRRGDYITNSVTNSYHGICDLTYYTKAMAVISERVTNPRFYVFSDEISWAKENIKSEFPIIYVHTGKNYEDLFLLTQCKHNIIANSSFSWWGAWLNNNHEKNIIAPEKWFNDPVVNSKFTLPSKWFRI